MRRQRRWKDALACLRIPPMAMRSVTPEPIANFQFRGGTISRHGASDSDRGKGHLPRAECDLQSDTVRREENHDLTGLYQGGAAVTL